MIETDIMVIAGVEIDFERILDEATEKVVSRVESATWKFNVGDRLIGDIGMLFRGVVWDCLVMELKSLLSDGGSYSAEQAMVEVMKKGVGTEKSVGKVKFRKKCFIFEMENSKYKVRKQENGYAAGPETEGGYNPSQMGWCPPESFARLVVEFDGLVPRVDAAAVPVKELVRIQLMKRKQERMVEEVQKKTLDILIEEYLTPLGISCSYRFEDDKVHLSLEQIKRGVIDTTLDQLADILKDTEGVKNAMKAIKPGEKNQMFKLFGY